MGTTKRSSRPAAKPKRKRKPTGSPGRRAKATDPRREAILAALRAGSTYEEAAVRAGVARGTFWRWRADDVTFRDACERALAEAEFSLVAVLASAARGAPATHDERGRVTRAEVPSDPRWAAWLLTHHPEFRKRYGERATIDITLMAETIAAENDIDAAEVIAELEEMYSSRS